MTEAPSATEAGRGTILVLNGPNLNLLGTREPEKYGTATLADVEQLAKDAGAAHGLDVECFQSNHEGALVDAIHAARGKAIGIVHQRRRLHAHLGGDPGRHLRGAAARRRGPHHQRACARGVPAPLVPLGHQQGRHRRRRDHGLPVRGGIPRRPECRQGLTCPPRGRGAPGSCGTGRSAPRWYRHFGTVDAPGSSACYADWSLHIADDPALIAGSTSGRTTSASRCCSWRPPASWAREVAPTASSGTSWTTTGRTCRGPSCRAPRKRTRPAAAPPCCRRWRPSPQPSKSRSRLSRWAPPPGSPCSRTATATSTTTAQQSRGWLRSRRPDGQRPHPSRRPAVRRLRRRVPCRTELPQVVWRAGIDLNPLDVGDDDDVALAGGADLARAGLPPRAVAPGDRRSPGKTRRCWSPATSTSS